MHESDRMTKPSPVRVSLFTVGFAALAIAAFFATLKSPPLPVDSPPEPDSGVPSGPIFSGSQLPPNILAALTELCGNCRVADSNGEWRATDVSIGPELPERRFTSIKSTDDHWEIRYERGGFVGRTYTLLLSKEVAPRVLPASTCSSAPQFECDW